MTEPSASERRQRQRQRREVSQGVGWVTSRHCPLSPKEALIPEPRSIPSGAMSLSPKAAALLRANLARSWRVPLNAVAHGLSQSHRARRERSPHRQQCRRTYICGPDGYQRCSASPSHRSHSPRLHNLNHALQSETTD